MTPSMVSIKQINMADTNSNMTYYQQNREKRLKYQNEYNKKNKEIINQKNRENQRLNKEKNKERNKQYGIKHRANWSEETKLKKLQQYKDYRELNENNYLICDICGVKVKKLSMWGHINKTQLHAENVKKLELNI